MGSENEDPRSNGKKVMFHSFVYYWKLFLLICYIGSSVYKDLGLFQGISSAKVILLWSFTVKIKILEPPLWFMRLPHVKPSRMLQISNCAITSIYFKHLKYYIMGLPKESLTVFRVPLRTDLSCLNVHQSEAFFVECPFI